MAHGNGKDPFAALLRDVEELKEGARLSKIEGAVLARQMDGLTVQVDTMRDDMKGLGEAMEALSRRMTSLSDTMAVVGQTMGVMAKGIAKQSGRSDTQEKLYARVAKTLIVLKSSTDDRFDAVEARLERSSSKH